MMVFGVIVTVLGFLIGYLTDYFVTGFLICLMGLVIVIAGDMQQEQDNLEACESVGGNYKVIDEDWNGKVYVDIYGCVKDQ